ncbi:MAG: deoxyuridine 5'-triphosphate nucleotidohydrolase [Fervidicoccaceae archaeon]
MALPGREVLRYVIGAADEAQVQPAGVDLTVQRVFKFRGAGVVARGLRVPAEVEELEPEGGVWRLEPGAYKIIYGEAVRVPEDCVGLCFPRSTLLRYGAFVECAVWDPGYEGRGESLLVVLNPNGLVLERGARVAQLIFIKTTERISSLYSGAYRGENM